MKKALYITTLLVFLSTACGLSGQAASAPQPTLVPTIFIPGHAIIPDTSGQGQTTLSPAAATAAAARQATPAPTDSGRVVPPGVVNIMVLGSDAREGAGHRTDVIMLVSIHTTHHTVSVVSFPRDLYVPIPGWSTQRINTAEPHGGFDMLADTMEANFSIRPSHYVMTDFTGFTRLIDRMGGIEVQAGASLTDRCDLPQAKNGVCTVEPGAHWMDGAAALWYVRSRHSTSDLDRTRRQQEVLSGIFRRVLDTRTQDWPELFAEFQSVVDTDLALGDVLPLLPTAATVFASPGMVRRYAISLNEVTPHVTDSGGQVLLPDYEKIFKILDEAVFR